MTFPTRDERAQHLAADVIRELARSGWGGRPDVIDIDRLSFTCDWGGCDEETTAIRWDTRSRAYLPVCDAHSGDRPPGGGP